MLLSVLRGMSRAAFVLVVLGFIGAAVAVGYGLTYFSRDLPDFQQIASYVPATGSKVYDADGKLVAEFETERRIPVSIDEVPILVINAFLAAEDRDFYAHKGVDLQAVFRAAVADIARFRSGQRPIGASTITQQVVRHFLLSRELSITRKIKEAILAYRLNKELSKDRILEIYLNEIYFGSGAYGVAAAADTYFQKKLDQLTPAEAAYLASLPKAPNNYHPIRNAAAAKARRDWVLAGMAELGWLGDDEAKRAIAEPLHVTMRPEPTRDYGYFVEEVRRGLIGRYGEKTIYEGGLTIRTSYAPATAADRGKGVSQRADRIRPPARMARADCAAGERSGGAQGACRDTGPARPWRVAARGGDRCRRERSQDRPARRLGRGDPDFRFALGASDAQGPAARGGSAQGRRCRAGRRPRSRRADRRQGAQGGGQAVRAAPDPQCQRRLRRNGPEDRADPRSGRRVVVPAEPVQPLDAGAAAARLVDQTVRLSDRADARLYDVGHDRRRAARSLAGSGAAGVAARQL